MACPAAHRCAPRHESDRGECARGAGVGKREPGCRARSCGSPLRMARRASRTPRDSLPISSLHFKGRPPRCLPRGCPNGTRPQARVILHRHEQGPALCGPQRIRPPASEWGYARGYHSARLRRPPGIRDSTSWFPWVLRGPRSKVARGGISCLRLSIGCRRSTISYHASSGPHSTPSCSRSITPMNSKNTSSPGAVRYLNSPCLPARSACLSASFADLELKTMIRSSHNLRFNARLARHTRH